jgi:hypothetical protein
MHVFSILDHVWDDDDLIDQLFGAQKPPSRNPGPQPGQRMWSLLSRGALLQALLQLPPTLDQVPPRRPKERLHTPGITAHVAYNVNN